MRHKVDLLTIVEMIRCSPEISRINPIDVTLYSFYQLSARFEDEINRLICRKDSSYVLVMSHENCKNALNAVKEKIGSQRHASIIVKNSKLRPFVKQLIEMEFPHVLVFSEEEPLPIKDKKIINEIELKDPGSFRDDIKQPKVWEIQFLGDGQK